MCSSPRPSAACTHITICPLASPIRIVAVEQGAVRVDASLAGMGAGAGNAPLEVFIAAADRMGWKHGCDLFALMDAAEDLVRPLQDRRARRPRDACARVCRRLFELPAPCREAAHEYGLDTRDILVELGRRRMVGGQEDMIVDVALDLLKSRDAAV